MQLEVHGCTDPGVPSKENQDTFLALKHNKHVFLAVFDGHGKSFGRLAAETAKEFFEKKFTQDQTYMDLHIDAEATLRHFFKECHQAIRHAFLEYHEIRNIKVEERPGGYLLVKQGLLQKSLLVQGGTTASIVILLDGLKLICANVGDSTSLLCAPKPFDGAWSTLLGNGTMSFLQKQGPIVSQPPEVPESSSILQLCGDHSAESLSEYQSITTARSVNNKGEIPELLFVFDGLAGSQRLTIREKHLALEKSPVFKLQDNVITKMEEGSYYKNVRQEWACLCCTPAKARYHESLAFTRSLGDFYIHHYGLTHEPDILQVDLKQLMETEQWSQVLIVAASDGIWDAWQYHEFSDELWKEWGENKDNISQVTANLMQKNKEVSSGIFGPSVDNMTIVVCSVQI